MGMYTECLIKASLKKGDKLDQLQKFIDGGDPVTATPRACAILHCNSYHHHPSVIVSLVDDYLFARFDLKDYDDDIKTFLEWLSDIVDEGDGRCIGWTWYEEDALPSLLVYCNGKIAAHAKLVQP